jgi:RNA polymerase sigma-70 factor (ECF subfamily)
MRACVRRFDNAADAEDAAHDAVESLLRKADTEASAAHARHYLYQVAGHRAIDAWRRTDRFEHIAWHNVSEEAHPVAPDPQEPAMTSQLLRALSAALDELPLNCRQAFVLNRIEGWTQREIAKSLKLSPSTVERHIARATQYIREHLSDDDWC